MPAEYTIDKQRRIILSRIYGEISDEEILQHRAELQSDPNFKPEFDQLNDYSEYTGNVSADTLRKMANTRSFEEGSRRALVVSSKFTFGMGRMYQLSIRDPGEDFQVFHELKLAREWLGLDEPSE